MPTPFFFFFFFFNDTATTEIYTLSLHDALPILSPNLRKSLSRSPGQMQSATACPPHTPARPSTKPPWRSEEHTSELQSQSNLVCRLLLEKKKNSTNSPFTYALSFLF